MKKDKIQNKMLHNEEEAESTIGKECDMASKPSGPPPAGYSNLSYPKCDTKTGTWYWYDPAIA